MCFREGKPYIESIDPAAISVNGVSIIGSTALCPDDWLSLGPALFKVGLPDAQTTPPVSTFPRAGRPGAVGETDGVITIGRVEPCQIVIPSPLVSREHARLVWQSGQWTLTDLGSTNGTFVNSQRIGAATALDDGDRVEVATFAFRFTGDTLQPLDAAGQVRVEVRDLYKEVTDRTTGQPKRLLDQIDLVFEPGEFIGVFGTSGSGKSTLLDALNGRRPASGGQVLYNGLDLYSSFDLFRATMGYVPQQDIVHRKIKVQRALNYTARLRLPGDTNDAEVQAQTTQVLAQVGLSEKAQLAIDTPVPLSGGQLKRVSLAVELVSDPNILFLDEVTSGLDAGTDKRMMELFAGLAGDGKTVICITHTLENIESCDLVALLHQGRVVYFGPPKEAPAYFGIERLSDVYELLEQSPPGEWAQKFPSSDHYSTYIAQRRSDAGAPGASQTESTPKVPNKPDRPWFDWRQAGTLMQRYCDLILADRRNLAILLLQAPLIGATIGMVFKSPDPSNTPTLMFLLVISAIWFGCLNSAREVVKELPIYLRERTVNLAVGPYLISKLIPLAALCAVQCITLLGTVALITDLPGTFVADMGVLFLAAMAATAMGLTISALVDSNDKAVAIVPILLIPQVIFANVIVTLGDTAQWVAKSTMISYWAFDAMKETLKDTLSQTYWNDLGMVSILGLAFTLSTLVGLKLKDRRR